MLVDILRLQGPCEQPFTQIIRKDGITIFTCAKFQEKTQTCDPPAIIGGDCYVAKLLRSQRSENVLPTGIEPVIRTTTVAIGLNSETPNSCTLDGETRELNPTPYRTLQALFEGGGDDVSYDAIYQTVSPGTFVPKETSKNVYVMVHRLKRDLGLDAVIEVVDGFGYRLKTPLSEPGITEGLRDSAISLQTIGARISIDENVRNKVWVDGEYILVSPIEYAFIRSLMRLKGKVAEFGDIHNDIYNTDIIIKADSDQIKEVAYRVSRKLNKPEIIESVRGFGYRMNTSPDNTPHNNEYQLKVTTTQTNLGTVVMDKNMFTVTLDGQRIALSKIEFHTLSIVLENPGTYLPLEMLDRLVNPTNLPDTNAGPSTSHNAINRINQKFGHSKDKQFIKRDSGRVILGQAQSESAHLGTIDDVLQ